MKKLLYLFFLIIFLLSVVGFSSTSVSANTLTFARLTTNASMFSEQNETSKIVTLPETYFVIVLGDATESGFIRVSYLDLVGYVRFSDVEVVGFEPRPRHHTATFTTTQFYDSEYVNLRISPNQNSQSVAQIATGEELFFYGTIEGSSLFGNNQWFKVRYENNDGAMFRGYLNYHHGTPSEIVPNNYEIVPPPQIPNPPVIPGEEFYTNLFIAIFIIALSIPAVFIMFLLFKKKQPVSREPRSF
ncbi:MAG: SH3 domain-containing protein [Firmicutes bacterium]|nr:SH3 domain-containing protein [Bacillota bacterium]